MNKIGICLVFLLVCISCIFNQACSQRNESVAVAQAFKNYAATHPREKIYVHTDKYFYVCGEIIWFRLYNVDALENKPANVSKVTYVELFDDHRKVVLQAKINMQDGLGEGSFYLPYSLRSGHFILRAYTSWMKNFDPSLFFEKKIVIVNTLKRLPAVVKDTARPAIQFFPEGGNLVEGIKSKVAFHVVDKNGKGLAARGVVYNQRNDSITSFSTSRFGMGYCFVQPMPGDNYKAAIKLQHGETFTSDLPRAFKAGYVMQLQTVNDDIRVTVESSGLSDDLVYLIVHTRQQLKIAEAKTLVNGKTEFLVKRDEPGDGVSHFTLLNAHRQPVCERLYFKRPAKKLLIDLATDKATYIPRERVSIRINAHDQGNLPLAASLSLSVFRMDSLQLNDEADIASFLWLASEVKGTIEDPAYYFNSIDSETAAVTDNVMLTHGWSRFKWEDVLTGAKPVISFLPEYEGMNLSIQVLNKRTGLPAGNVKCYLSIPGQQFVFRAATTDADGRALFNCEKFFGHGELILQARGEPGESYTAQVTSPFANEKPSLTLPSLKIPARWNESLLSYSINSQVQQVYMAEEQQQFLLPHNFDTTRFFGMPDKTYWLDDYTRFISMEEVMREYVSEVRVRKENGHFSYRVKNSLSNLFFDKDPLVLLDGVPVFDLDRLMTYDPLKIKKLDLVNRRFLTGRDGVEGIVSYSTYSGNMEGFPLDPNTVSVNYEGLQLHREFYSPVYETPAQLESPIPDFRNLLYWSPILVTGSDGTASAEFYTSDRPGRYVAVIQGLTPSGHAGSQTYYFNVMKQ